MEKITQKKITDKAKVVTDKTTMDYTNDPYFVKKREMAAVFLKKVGLPESFTKQQSEKATIFVLNWKLLSPFHGFVQMIICW